MLRYHNMLPRFLFELDPKSSTFSSSLKLWISENIPQDGDKIFKGKVRKEDEADWLTLELREWKKQEEHESQSHAEFQMLESSELL